MWPDAFPKIHNLFTKCSGMKQLLVCTATLLLMISCGNEEKKTESKTESGTETQTTQTETPQDPEVEKGLQLVAQSDCLTCHKIADNYTGPSYQAIAAKYENTPAVIDSLAQKIIKGGAGVWGTVPMTPHPQVSQEDARTMVKYVLSLKQ
jgi:cytochrome c